MKSGVNFFGPFEARDSIGRVAALNIECLKAGDIPHEIHLLSRPAPNQTANYATIDDELISTLRHKINLFHFNARRVPLYFSRLGEGSLKGFYNIGFWVHEMEAIPNQWARQLEFFDEIWTPSSLCQSAVSLSANIPVLRMPYPIESAPVSTRMEARLSGMRYSEFNFVSIFDVASDAERKNPLFTVRAFLSAFKDNFSVKLILKTRNLDCDLDLQNMLFRITEKHRNVVIIDGYMEYSELNELYSKTDVYVSLHRAEGFGLTISDAISRGIPVLTTGYSGNMDFCNAADTRLVSYELRHVGYNRPRYRSYDRWAEPDMDDTVEAFIELFADHKRWIEKALKARKRVIRDFSVDAVANLMSNRIKLISNNFTFPDDMSNRDIDFEVGIGETYGF